MLAVTPSADEGISTRRFLFGIGRCLVSFDCWVTGGALGLNKGGITDLAFDESLGGFDVFPMMKRYKSEQQIRCGCVWSYEF